MGVTASVTTAVTAPSMAAASVTAAARNHDTGRQSQPSQQDECG
jgi:hypothetical protein